MPGGANYIEVQNLLQQSELHTVCEEAHCPNIGECWENRSATFMVLGDICTRSCRYCAVTSGRPLGLDLEEPKRLALASPQVQAQLDGKQVRQLVYVPGRLVNVVVG